MSKSFSSTTAAPSGHFAFQLLMLVAMVPVILFAIIDAGSFTQIREAQSFHLFQCVCNNCVERLEN